MKRKILTAVAFLLLLNVVAAQRYKKFIPAPTHTIRLSLPGFLDLLDANFTPGIEFWLKSQWTAGIDLGYIYASIYRGDVYSTSGVLARPFVRYYFSESQGGFLQAQLHFKYVKYQKEEWVNQQSVNGIPSFSRVDMVSYNKRAAGIHFLYGYKGRLSRQQDHINIEISCGLGYRYKWQDVPENNRGQFTITTFNNKEKLSTPVVLANFMICYKL